MMKGILEKHGLIILVVVMVVLMVIVATVLLYSGTTPPPRVTLDIQSTGSTDSPQSMRYLLVEAVHPDGTKVRWKDVHVVVRPDCTTFEGNPDDCPGAVDAIQGKDYVIHDSDGNGRVSHGDVMDFNISANAHWGKVVMLQWTKTSNIMYKETLPLA